MADETPRKGGGGLQRAVLWLVIAALLGTVWWLASERNERHYRVAAENGQLVIERGRFFPTGSSPSTDKTYAAIAIPAGEKAPGEIEFDDQNALDRWLFDVLTSWAREAAKKGDTHSAAALVDRASALPGLTGAQNGQLASLKADLAWDDAAADVQQAGQLLDAAVRNLQSVVAGKGPRALDAAKESDRLRGIAQSLKPAK
ncbi:MAG: hypothetical protein ABR567_05450 [Myxococcales bacterium]|nr:hypothetical protein [Myxococcales bacterium]